MDYTNTLTKTTLVKKKITSKSLGVFYLGPGRRDQAVARRFVLGLNRIVVVQISLSELAC
jgi:hypothetical protein